MRRFAAVLALGLACLAGAAPSAHAAESFEAPLHPGLIDEMIQKTMDEWRGNAASITEADQARARKSRRFHNVALRSPSLDRASASTAIELATAAIRTSLDGTEAGVSIAPAGLLGASDSPHQPTLSLATLEGDKIRYAAGYNYQTALDAVTPGDLGLDGCTLSKKREAALRSEIQALAYPYEQVCAAVQELRAARWRTPPATELDRLAEAEAVSVCTPSEPHVAAVVSFRLAAQRLVTFFEREKKRAALMPPLEDGTQAAQALSRVLGPRAYYLDRIAAFKEPSHDCYEDSDIASALANYAWHTPAYRLGASFTLDTFANVFGFNPKPSDPLTKGQPARAEGRVEGARVTGPCEFHLGAGLGKSRDVLSDPYKLYVAPSVSFAAVVASLSGDHLYSDDGKLNDVEGKAPPRLVVGVDAELQYTFSPPDTQKTHIDKLKLSAFFDFRFTEDLGFRVGVPVQAKVVTREADPDATPPVTEERRLQWSVPVFLTSVLKM